MAGVLVARCRVSAAPPRPLRGRCIAGAARAVGRRHGRRPASTSPRWRVSCVEVALAASLWRHRQRLGRRRRGVARPAPDRRLGRRRRQRLQPDGQHGRRRGHGGRHLGAGRRRAGARRRRHRRSPSLVLRARAAPARASCRATSPARRGSSWATAAACRSASWSPARRCMVASAGGLGAGRRPGGALLLGLAMLDTTLVTFSRRRGGRPLHDRRPRPPHPPPAHAARDAARRRRGRSALGQLLLCAATIGVAQAGIVVVRRLRDDRHRRRLRGRSARLERQRLVRRPGGEGVGGRDAGKPAAPTPTRFVRRGREDAHRVGPRRARH